MWLLNSFLIVGLLIKLFKQLACLISYRTEQHNVVTVHVFFFFYHQSTSKHSHFFFFFFFFFFFYFLFICKIFFLFFYTNSFYFISHHHFLLILKLTTHYSVLFCTCLCQTSPTTMRKRRVDLLK
jgi:hypothetical protein